MKDFAPLPLSALDGRHLSPSELRLLAHLLGLRGYFGYTNTFAISDIELLKGTADRRRRKSFAGCGLSRNTLKKARSRLETLGYIRCSKQWGDTGREHYQYELAEGKAIIEKTDNCELLTLPVSHDATSENLQVPDRMGDVSESAGEQSSKELSHDEKGHRGARRRGRFLTGAQQQVLNRLICKIEELYYERNGHPMPMPSRVRSEMKRFLLDNPTYEEDELLRAIVHRFDSKLNPSQSPVSWIPRLFEFVKGPLEFGRMMEDYVPRHGLARKSAASAPASTPEDMQWPPLPFAQRVAEKTQ